MRRPKRNFLGNLLLKVFIDKGSRDAKIGDINEIFEDMVKNGGNRRGIMWYWGEVFKTIPMELLNRLKWYFLINVNHLKLTFRSLVKGGVHSILNILGLSVGIGVFILMTLMVRYETSFDNFHKNSEEIYQIGTIVKVPKGEVKQWVTDPPAGGFLKRKFPQVRLFSRLLNQNTTVKVEGASLRHKVSFVDPGFFEIFSFPLIEGEGLIQPDSALISRACKVKIFGKNQALGKTVKLVNYKGEEQLYFIAGIVEDIPGNSSIRADFFIPFQSLEGVLGRNFFEGWGRFCLKTFIKTQGKIEPILGKFNRGVKEKYKISYRYFARNIGDIHFASDVNAADVEPVNQIYLWIGFSLGVTILLMGIGNLINISQSKIRSRIVGSGIRKIFGATKGEIFAQVIREYIVMVSISSLIGLTFTILLKERFGINFSGDFLESVIYFITLSILIGIFAGLFPALMLSGPDALTFLKGFKIKNRSFTGIAVFLQFTLIIFLIFCGTVMGKQLKFVMSRDLGFDKEVLVAVNLNSPNNKTLVENFRNSISQYKSLISVSGIETFPGLGFGETVITVKGEKLHSKVALADGWLVETAGFNIFKGDKRFGDGDFIVNRKFASLLGSRNLYGASVNFGQGVVGTLKAVIDNHHIDSLYGDIPPVTYRISKSFEPEHLLIKVDTGSSSYSKDILEIFAKIAPDYRVELYNVKELFNSSYKKDEMWWDIVNTSTVIALIISIFGLTGISVVSMEKRKKEIGIRKVLGAGRGELTFKITSQLIGWTIFALIPAFASGHIFINRWLENFVYRTDIGLIPYLFSGSVAIVTAVITAGIQVWRGASNDPLKSIKEFF